MTLEEQVSLWKNLDLSKEDLPANLDTKNVQVTVEKVTIKVNVSTELQLIFYLWNT